MNIFDNLINEVHRNRTIRPSTRLESSKSYKINTENVSHGEILVVNIDHESKPFQKTYRFAGSDVAHKKSISFRVNDYGSKIDISWSGAKPIGKDNLKTKKPLKKKRAKKVDYKSVSSNTKTSFKPISNSETRILILGSMPGDKSLASGEYYGHPRNRFWKIISTIANKDLPITYSDKKELLINTKIGIWDVAHKANREGSLDSAIKNEEPNDLEGFIKKHKNLEVIGFNGRKAEVMYDKFFARIKDIKYISLPSTSPANTGTDFLGMCNEWKELVE